MMSGDKLNEREIMEAVEGGGQVGIECSRGSATEQTVMDLNARRVIGYARRGSFLFAWKASSLGHARDKDSGFKVTQDKESWEAGYQAGLKGNPRVCPSGFDELSFWSGVIEGKAARRKATGG